MAGALFMPASTGLTPAVVSQAKLQQANQIQQLTSSGAGIAGPALAGLLVVAASPGWAIVAVSAVFNFLISAYFVLGPVVSQRSYGGAAAWATVATIWGVGSVVGGLLTLRLRPRHPLRLAVSASCFLPLPSLAFAAGLPLPAIAVIAAFGGTVAGPVGAALGVHTVLWATGLIELAAILSLLLVPSIRQLTNEVPATIPSEISPPGA